MIETRNTDVKKPVIQAVPDPEVPRKQFAGSSPLNTKGVFLRKQTPALNLARSEPFFAVKDSLSSSLTSWRRQVNRGLAPKKRGPATRTPDPNIRRIAQLEKDTARLTHKLKQAELIIEVQKKVAALLQGLEKVEENS